MKAECPDVLAEDQSPPLRHATIPVPPTDRHLWEITPIWDLLWLAGIAFLLWFGYYLRGVLLLS
jgi:type VI protein secretion system component VasF